VTHDGTEKLTVNREEIQTFTGLERGCMYKEFQWRNEEGVNDKLSLEQSQSLERNLLIAFQSW
jgi:glutamine amidotransferase-like uncharacterized protein